MSLAWFEKGPLLHPTDINVESMFSGADYRELTVVSQGTTLQQSGLPQNPHGITEEHHWEDLDFRLFFGDSIRSKRGAVVLI